MPDRFHTVDEFLSAQEPTRRAQAEALRALAHQAEPALTENVKWNSPNYVLDGVDRLTVNAAGRGPVRLILHFGTARPERTGAAPTFPGDPDGLLTWHSDIRASLVAPPSDAPDTTREAILAVVRAWLAFEPDA